MDQFHFFYMWLSNFSNTIYWRDCPFPIVYSCLLHCTLVEYIHMVLVLGSILLHWSMSIFMPMPYCFDYHSFVIQFSIREGVPPAFFFFFRVLFFWLLGFSNLYLKMPPPKYYSKMLFVENLGTTNYSFKLLKYFILPTALKTYF